MRVRNRHPLGDVGSVGPAPAGTDGHAGAAYREGALLLITVVIAWGLTWPVNKVILESLSPLWLMAFRSVLATVTLFAISLGQRRLVLPPLADIPVLLSITLLHMVGFALLAAWGLQLVPTGRSVVLAYTTPLWVTPGASLFLGERLTPRRIVGAILGLVGLAVLFNPLAFDWANRKAVLGNGAIIVAAMLWAASILHIRGHRWHSTPFDLAPWEMLLATVILTPLAVATSTFPEAEWNVRLVSLLLYAGVPGTALAYWAIAVASRNLPAVTTSLGLLATPVVSVTVATIWLGESLTWSLLVAIVWILGGVAIGVTDDQPPPRRLFPDEPVSEKRERSPR